MIRGRGDAKARGKQETIGQVVGNDGRRGLLLCSLACCEAVPAAARAVV